VIKYLAFATSEARMPIFIGEAEAMIAFARRVWGIEPSKKGKKPPQLKVKKTKKPPPHPRGMP
jgi:hypothetical protein